MANSILLWQRQFRRRKTPFSRSLKLKLAVVIQHPTLRPLFQKDCQSANAKSLSFGGNSDLIHRRVVKKITSWQYVGDSKEICFHLRALTRRLREISRCYMERASTDKIQTESGQRAKDKRGLFAARLLLICATCVPQDDALLAPCVTSNWVGPQNSPHFSAPVARVSCSPVASENFAKVFPDQSIFHVRLTFCCVQNPKSFL